GGPDAEAAALLLESLGHRDAAFARLQHAGGGLEERDPDSLGVHLRVAASKLVGRQSFVGHAILVERRFGGLEAPVPFGREQQPPSLMEEAPSPLRLAGLPAIEGFEHPACVQLAVFVAGADLPGLASGAGPRVAGAVGVDE